MTPTPPATSLPQGSALGDALAALSSSDLNTMAVEVDLAAQPPAAPRPAAPRFEPVRQLAQGGLGRVSVAFDAQLRRHVALKEIRQDRATAEARRRFLAEAEITGQLEHPGIVPIYALERDERGEPRYAMRLIEGKTFGEAIREHHAAPTPLRFRELLQRFISVCQTVGYAHSKGVIHRDLKPANVMLGAFGETLVVDWGLAKKLGAARSAHARSTEFALDALDAAPAAERPARAAETDSTLHGDAGGTDAAAGLTRDGDILGTPSYMSPEQAEGKPEQLGPAADIYSLGTILYELLADRPPYLGDAVSIILQLREGRLTPPGRHKPVAKPLEAICLKALAAQPAERYGSALDLAQDLQRFLADEPTLAYPEPWRLRLRRWLRRRRTLVAAAAAALAVAAVSLGVGLAFLSKKNEELSGANARLREEEARTKQALAGELLRRRQAYRHLDDLTSGFLGDAAMQQGREGLTPEQQATLRRAIEAYGEIAASADGDRAGRRAQAEAYRRLGLLRMRFGELTQAETDFRRSLALLEKLQEEDPGNQELKMLRADAQGHVGMALCRQRRLRAGLEAYRAAVRLREEVQATTGGEDARLIGRLAKDYANLAFSQEDLGDFAAAKESHRRAQAFAEDAVKLKPGDPAALHTLTLTLTNQCSLFIQLDDLTAAIQAAEKAIRLLEPVATDALFDRELTHDLAAALSNRGMLHHLKEEHDAALAAFLKAQRQYERLLLRLPAEPAYRQALAEVLHNQGVVLRDQGKLAESVEPFRRAAETLELLLLLAPKDLGARRTLVRCLHNQADLLQKQSKPEEALALLKRTAAECERLLGAADATPEERGRAGAVLMELALLHSGRGETAEAIAANERAARILRQLRADHPKDPQHAVHLAGVLCNLGGQLAKQEPEKAPPLFDEAQALLEGALKVKPTYAKAKENLRNVWEHRAEWRERQGDSAGAAAARAKAEALDGELKKLKNR